jgi:Cd2+/Zn2+-exporting ATPase
VDGRNAHAPSRHHDHELGPKGCEDACIEGPGKFEGPDIGCACRAAENGNHSHSHGHEGGGLAKRVTFLALALALLLVAALLQMERWLALLLYGISYLLAGGSIVWAAVRSIGQGSVFDENFLMTIATIGAAAIGEYTEAVAVMLFYGVGELLQDLAVQRSRNSIADLMDIRPDFANVKRDGTAVQMDPASVEIGEIILVKPGEKVPLDGLVENGYSFLDTLALTGESVPREVFQGSEVLSGSINQSGALEIRTTKLFGESTVSKILQLVEKAGEKKAASEKFITRFARYYTPVVVGVAVAVALVPPLILGFGVFNEWLYRALTFLIVSCPCALVISIPIGFFGGIGGASRQGVLVKGGNFLERLGQVDAVVFDKTGTLTQGSFEVDDVLPAPGVEPDRLTLLAAVAESGSNHPIAQSIVRRFGRELSGDLVQDYTEIAGKGVQAKTQLGDILAGNARLMQERGIDYIPCDSKGAVVYVAADNVFVGAITITDTIKKTAAQAVQELRELGVSKISMLSGDSWEAVEFVARQVEIGEYSAQMLPQDKVAAVERVMEEREGKGALAFVGDGINDAPVLALADVGVAMGGIGSDAAIEAADVVLMGDDPQKLPVAIRIARKTLRIVKGNIALALGIKAIILLWSLVGHVPLWIAIFADVGVALLAVMNAMRAMKI